VTAGDAGPVAVLPRGGHDREVTDRAMVSRWLAGYETAWRAPGTGGLADLFAGDATYLQSPYEPPVTGLDAIRRMWDEQREGAGQDGRCPWFEEWPFWPGRSYSARDDRS
jgi:hypothetical protein